MRNAEADVPAPFPVRCYGLPRLLIPISSFHNIDLEEIENGKNRFFFEVLRFPEAYSTFATTSSWISSPQNTSDI